MELRVRHWIKARAQKAGNIYLGVPHRIDRPVSGVLVFARHVRAARRISEQFEDRLVRKTYWACVQGRVDPAEGTWQDYLLKVPGEPRAMVVDADHPDARLARLHYRTLGESPWGSWLEIELETGRTHQIRVQASTRGFPVLGDTLYGSPTRFGVQHDDERLRAIALHGRTIEFRHPMNREPVRVVAPLAAAWQALKLPLDTDSFEPDDLTQARP
jgi:RluA family pseudouridine synthase